MPDAADQRGDAGAELPLSSPIELARRLAALLGLLGLVGVSALWYLRPEQLRRAYVASLGFWAMLTLGSLALGLASRLVPSLGRATTGRVGMAAWPTLPLLAVLAAPLAANGALPSWPGGPCTVALLLLDTLLVAALLHLTVLSWLACEEPLVLPRPARTTLMRTTVLLLVASLPLRLGAPPWSAVALGVDLLGALLLLLPWPGLREPPSRLGLLALGLLVAHGFERTSPARISDAVAPAMTGGLWLAYFFARLDRRPPAPLPPGPTAQAPLGGVG